MGQVMPSGDTFNYYIAKAYSSPKPYLIKNPFVMLAKRFISIADNTSVNQRCMHT